ncbi:MAG: response regulator transcription factor [Caldisericaceae bacterium]|nr:response regulator transcription factor [Caldisericaceae bacterium]
MNRILLVEDEESLARGLQFNLEAEGYKVTLARDGQQAIEFFDQQEFDLVILDVMLPYHDGFEIAQYIREKSQQLPILFLTARRSPDDRIKGLKLGADDYLAKPFSLDELLLRVKRILQRKSWYLHDDLQKFQLGHWEIDLQALQITGPEKTINLTQLEANVLKYLLERRGKVVSRQELLENVWQTDAEIETRTVDIFIARLRKYLNDDPANPQWIKSVRGIGYMIAD